VIHRWNVLRSGGLDAAGYPENLMQIIGIYKAYAVPMDFYWRDLLYIAERVFLNPLPAFKYFLPQEYLDLPQPLRRGYRRSAHLARRSHRPPRAAGIYGQG
jgi:hypothetical protein